VWSVVGRKEKKEDLEVRCSDTVFETDVGNPPAAAAAAKTKNALAGKIWVLSFMKKESKTPYFSLLLRCMAAQRNDSSDPGMLGWHKQK
jgi:hypothetical protein